MLRKKCGDTHFTTSQYVYCHILCLCNSVISFPETLEAIPQSTVLLQTGVLLASLCEHNVC